MSDCVCIDDSESPFPLHGLLWEEAHKPDKYRVLSGETFTGTLFMLNTYFYMFDIGYSKHCLLTF